jgi:replicative DNA helicase
MENKNIEKELLIYCLKDLASLNIISTKSILPDQFSTEANRTLYRSIKYVFNNYDSLLDERMLQEYVFGRAHITNETLKNEVILLLYDLSQQPLPTVPLSYVIDQFKNNYLKKQLRDSILDVNEVMKTGDVPKAIELYQRNLIKLKEFSEVEPIETLYIGDAMKQLKEDYKNRKEHPEKFKGLSIGFPTFDGVTDGLHPGQVTLLVGPEKAGKSIFITNVIYNILQMKGGRIANFVTESGVKLPTKRLAIRHSGVNANLALKSELDPEEEAKFFEAVKYYDNMDSYIVSSISPSFCTASVIKKELEKYEDKGKFDLVIVDHIGLVNTDDFESRQKEHTRLERVIIELVDLARTKNVAVIAVTHVNREAAKKKGDTFHTYDLARSYNMGHHIDTMISLCPKKPDELKQMKSGEIIMSIPTIRDGQSVSLVLEADLIHMKIDEKSLTIVEKEAISAI